MKRNRNAASGSRYKLQVVAVIFLASSTLLSSCVPPDDYHPKTSALKQSQALQLYEEAMGFHKQRQYAEAIPRFTRSIELDPDFAEGYIARGDAFTETREYEKALKDFDQAFKLAPDIVNDRDSIYIYRDLAVCHAALKQWDKVVQDCDKMLAFNPRYSFAYMARSVAFDNLGKVDLAKKDADTYENLKHPVGPKGQ